MPLTEDPFGADDGEVGDAIRLAAASALGDDVGGSLRV